MRIGLYVFLTVTYAMTLNRFGLAEWKITDSTSPHIHRSQSLTLLLNLSKDLVGTTLLLKAHTQNIKDIKEMLFIHAAFAKKRQQKKPSTNLRLLSLGLRTLLCGRPYKGQDFGIPQPESLLTLVSVINRRLTGARVDHEKPYTYEHIGKTAQDQNLTHKRTE